MINIHNIKQNIRLGAIGLGFFLAAQLLFSPVQVRAATPPDSCFDFDTGTGTIDSYYEYEDGDNSNPACPKNVDIPSTIASTPVTAIGNTAFTTRDLTAVTIPSSVVSIGDNAFAYNDITALVLPNSVTTMGQAAFLENNIVTLTLSESLTSIPDYAFQMNPITSLVVPDSVTAIGAHAFRMNDISSLTLGNSVQTIGSLAFQLNRISTVNIPNSVLSIDPSAFMMNSSIGYAAMIEALESGDPSEINQAFSTIFIVALYTEDPSNPNGLQDSILTEADLGGDLNGNGNESDVVGGHRINPSDDEDGSSGGDGSSDSEDTLASTGQNSVAVIAFAASMVLLSLALPIKKLITKRDNACHI